MKLDRLSQFKPYIKPLLGFAFFALALLACHHLLIEVHPSAIRDAIQKISPWDVILAFGATALSYLMLIGYEDSADKYAGGHLSLQSLAFGSFCSFAVSNAVGLTVFSGGTVRYRLYAPHGLRGIQIAKLTLFSSGAFMLTLPLLSSIFLLAESRYAATLLNTSERLLIVLAALPLVLGAITAGFLYWNRLPNRTEYTWFSKVGPYQIELPVLWLAARQFVIGSLDIVATGTVLYVLLPNSVGFGDFLLVYFIAMAAGVLSNIPGGLGIFETVILTAFSHSVDPASLAAALVLYRLIYYIVPLLLATVLLLGNELHRKKEKVKKLIRLSSAFVPPLMALLVFISGLILILSGSTPFFFENLKFLGIFIPMPLINTFHLVASVIGVFCLLLAKGLFDRLSGAWLMTVVLLALGSLFSLLKGLDWKAATFLFYVAAQLFFFRQAFYRTSRLNRLHYSPTYLLTLGGVLAIAFWLLFFSYKNIGYAGELWWEFGLNSEVSRSLRAFLACSVIILLVAVRWLISTPFSETRPTESELDSAKDVLMATDMPDAALALSGDKMILFNNERDAFIMYGRQRRSLIALFDPIGPPEKQADLLWRFRDLCDQYLYRPVFYQVAAENLSMYMDVGFVAYKIGEEAIVDLDDFTLESGRGKDLRHIHNHGVKEGISFEIHEPGTAPMSELKRISDQWLTAKHVREKGFSLGRFDEEYLKHFRIATLKRNDEIIAFANLFEPSNRLRVSADMMRYSSKAPKSAMAFLFVALMKYYKEQGYKEFTLGMAPLSGVKPYRNAPWIQKFGSFLFHRGEFFYNFQGLRKFKEKFNPTWESRYIAIPRNDSLLVALADTSILIAGGVAGIVKK